MTKRILMAVLLAGCAAWAQIVSGVTTAPYSGEIVKRSDGGLVEAKSESTTLPLPAGCWSPKCEGQECSVTCDSETTTRYYCEDPQAKLVRDVDGKYWCVLMEKKGN